MFKVEKEELPSCFLKSFFVSEEIHSKIKEFKTSDFFSKLENLYSYFKINFYKNSDNLKSLLKNGHFENNQHSHFCKLDDNQLKVDSNLVKVINKLFFGDLRNYYLSLLYECKEKFLGSINLLSIGNIEICDYLRFFAIVKKDDKNLFLDFLFIDSNHVIFSSSNSKKRLTHYSNWKDWDFTLDSKTFH